MQEINLDVVVRQTTKKGEVKRSRELGQIPAVIYGKGEENLNGYLDAKTFGKIIKSFSSGNTIFNLNINGLNIGGAQGVGIKKAIIKDIQIDVVKRHPIHVDFQVVSMASKIEVSVPIKLVGDAPGVKLHGGILEHFIRELKVKCLPKDIPEFLPVDVSALEIGKSFTVGELSAIEGVEYHADPHAMILNVVAPKKEEVVAPEAAVAASAAAEPEVISKGKKEEEGAEGEAKEGKEGKEGKEAKKSSDK